MNKLKDVWMTLAPLNLMSWNNAYS